MNFRPSASSRKGAVSRKSLAIVGVILVLLLVVAYFLGFFGKSSSDSSTSDESSTPESLVSQYNYDLRTLSETYNNLIDSSNGANFILGETYLNEFESEIAEVETERESAKTVKKYSSALSELDSRLETIRSGTNLIRAFHEAFFWPVSALAVNLAYEPKNQEALLNNSDASIASAAKNFLSFYNYALSNPDADKINTYAQTNAKKHATAYYTCFSSLSDPDEFYDSIQTELEQNEK